MEDQNKIKNKHRNEFDNVRARVYSLSQCLKKKRVEKKLYKKKALIYIYIFLHICI